MTDKLELSFIPCLLFLCNGACPALYHSPPGRLLLPLRIPFHAGGKTGRLFKTSADAARFCAPLPAQETVEVPCNPG